MTDLQVAASPGARPHSVMRVKPEGQATSGSLKSKSAMLVHCPEPPHGQLDIPGEVMYTEGLLLFLLSQSVSENSVSHLRDKLPTQHCWGNDDW